MQNKAFAHFQKELNVRLQGMDRCDKSFWRITKEIGGIEAQRSGAAPSVDELADNFATKMSNGKDDDVDSEVQPQDLSIVPLSCWKVSRKRVKHVLLHIDASKFTNGVSPVFWKETAHVVYGALTKLYQRIVKDSALPFGLEDTTSDGSTQKRVCQGC